MLNELEKKIKRVYKQAEKDLIYKFEKYMESFERLTILNYRKVESGEWTQEQFNTWRINKIAIGKRWQSMIDYATKEYAHANYTALAYINDSLPYTYTVTYNEVQSDIAGSITGYSFNLVNEDAVRYMIDNEQIDLPPRKLDIPKDRRWNAKQINAQVLQGIIQGESNKAIAKRLQNVSDMNYKSAIRNARTMTTYAENRGRLDSMKTADDKGILTEKEWLATGDGRTRDNHLLISGTRIPMNEKFIVGNSEMDCPADPHGDPAEVYNCRCRMKVIPIGFKSGRGISKINDTSYRGNGYTNTDKVNDEISRRRTKAR